MKRVKTSSPTPADRSGQQPSSEPPSMASSMSTSVSGSMTASTGGGSATAFKSPLLQGLMAKQQASGETTPEKKFSSPLLNNLMGKLEKANWYHMYQVTEYI